MNIVGNSNDKIRILIKDLDGNRYAVPESLVEDFKIMNEAIQLVEWGSEEWFKNTTALRKQFAEYIKE